MTVQIKPLKGFKNPINHELCTLSLLVKSNHDLQKHLTNANGKMLISLTSIIDHYKNTQEIYFYHKLQISQGRRTTYPKTKRYKTSLVSLKVDLDDSIENLIGFETSKFDSHFINVIIVKDNETIELSDDEFYKLNSIIRSKLTKINKEDLLFVNEDNEGHSSFIDNNDKGQFEKPSININNKVSLFIDDDDDDPFEKAIINARDIDLRIKRDTKITNKKFINFLEVYVLP